MGAPKDFGEPHANSRVLYRSVEEDVMLMVEAADFFTKSSLKASSFHAAVFYKAVKLMLTEFGRAVRTICVGRACLLPVAHVCEAAVDPESVKVCERAVSKKHAQARL